MLKLFKSSALITITLLIANHTAAAAPLTLTMIKNKGCECCERWANTLKPKGFNVNTIALDDVTPVKNQAGIPLALRSCHTAKIGGYVFEGHVPADLIIKVLKDKPKIAGLAAPGMPLGAPGMDIQGASTPYQVIAFTRNGKTSVYAQR